MTAAKLDASYVLFVAGEHVSPETVPAPTGAVAVWCRDADEIEDRATRLHPRCVVIDASGTPDVSAAALAVRRSVGTEAIVVAVSSGNGNPVPAEVDYQVASTNLRAELLRVMRFALGQRIRAGTRVRCQGRALLALADGHTLDLPIRDLSEDGVRVRVAPGLPEDRPVRLELSLCDGRTVSVEGVAVRRSPKSTDIDGSLVYRFLDLEPRARASLRAFLVRRAVGALAPTGEPAPVAAPGPRARVRSVRMIGRSAPFARMLETIERVAPNDVTVLLLGETGTGKELAARALHEGSPRAERPLVAVNCAALPENLVESELFGHEPGAFTGAHKRKIGRIEQASGGTLFLDEIGDLPAGAQAKLLRALQERVIERVGGTEPIRVDIRLIAATNQDLEAGMAKRSFRRDLFFRLNVVAITLPPLRERPEDILLLADHFLRRAEERMGKSGIRLNAHAHETLLRYPWPGNVRELENLCTRLVALAQSSAVLGPEHLNLFIVDELADSPLPSTDLRDILDFCEREIVRRMLDRNGGNRTKTARALGISRQALQQKLARFRGLAQPSPGDDDCPSPGELAATDR
ncbi:MAG TPA: sigma 54-interacting transcriptional regulator [Polyangia bacterium]|nr:sigma 54-interacting transcriptional regulator [Polyangia bacterium]